MSPSNNISGSRNIRCPQPKPPISEENPMTALLFRRASVIALAFFAGGIPAVAQNGRQLVVPVFEVDPAFPSMPDNMLLGGVGGATADSHGNVWAFHRPHTLEEGKATENGFVPAPPAVEFSTSDK